MNTEIAQTILTYLGCSTIDPIDLMTKFNSFFGHISISPKTTLTSLNSSIKDETTIEGFCISGFSGSGKGTVAKMMNESNEFTLVSFASALKDVVAWLFNFDREMIEGETMESRLWRESDDNEFNMKPRYLLQTIGTDVFKSLDEMIWINAFFKNIKNKKIIVTDARFLNELESLSKYNIRFINVKNNRLETHRLETHRSEVEHLMFNKYDYIIHNDGTLDDLREKLLKMKLLKIKLTVEL